MDKSKRVTVKNWMRRRYGLLTKLAHGQKGIGIVETLVALAILGVISVGFLSAIATSYTAVRLSDQRTTAESVARSMTERIRVAPYPLVQIGDADLGVVGVEVEGEIDPVPLDQAFPSDYTAWVSVDDISVDVTPPSYYQEVTVVVKHQDRTILTTITYKVDPNINLPQSGAGG